MSRETMPACTCGARTLQLLEMSHHRKADYHRLHCTDHHERTCPRWCGCVERWRAVRRTATEPDAHDSECPWYVEPPPPPTREETLRRSLVRFRGAPSGGMASADLLIELIVGVDRTNELLERLLDETGDGES